MADFDVTDEELTMLMSGSARRADSTSRERAQLRFDDNAEAIALGLVEIAKDKNIAPAVRVKAATYCLDRVMGPTSAINSRNEVDDVLMDMVKNFTKAE